MKPKTKEHFRVLEVSKTLKKISFREVKKMKDNLFWSCCFKRYKTYYCSECNHQWEKLDFYTKESNNYSGRKEFTKCPHCKKELLIIDSQRFFNFISYAVQYDYTPEYQIIRIAEITKSFTKDKKASYKMREPSQMFINVRTGVITLYSSKYGSGWFGNYAGFDHQPMEIRPYARKYDHTPESVDIVKGSIIHPHIYRNGYDDETKFVAPTLHTHWARLLGDRTYETLWKKKENGYLTFYENVDYRYKKIFGRIVMAMVRRNYINEKTVTSSDYKDYFRMCVELKYDLHDLTLMVPVDFHAAHKKVLVAFNAFKAEQKRIRDLENAELQARLRREANKDYAKKIEKFKDLIIKKGNLKIVPLISIEDVEQEGNELLHCVYSMSYYTKEKSLLLSARIDDKRTETIEVDLSKMNILQARGFDNKPTKHHKTIIDLFNKNKRKIKECYERQIN